MRPRLNGWKQIPFTYPRGYGTPYVIEKYWNPSQEVQAITSIEVVRPEGGGEPRPEYHVSVSGFAPDGQAPYRVSESRAQWALQQFSAAGFLEDNHVPNGVVRNFWRPVADPAVGEVCKCVDEEPAMHEMKGDFTWRGVGR